MYKTQSSNIRDFPFHEYAKLNQSQLEALAKTHSLTLHNSWMLPQIMAHYGNWKLQFNNSRVDPLATARANILTDWDIGLWRVVTQLKRGSLVKSQIDPEFTNYSALVPIILAGAKRDQGIKYSDWAITSDCPLIDKNLLEAMCFELEPEPDQPPLQNFGLSRDRILELREIGLTTKSGDNKGKVSKPTSQWCLRGIKGTELEGMPKLVGTMLAQIWVAHPTLRTELMILDPQNWDFMPEALVDADIFKSKPQFQQRDARGVILGSDLPWNA